MLRLFLIMVVDLQRKENRVMTKYIGPKCKLAKRENFDLSLKVKAMHKKCNISKKPGQTEGASFRRETLYNKQLREKQKTKRIYGILENTFKKYYSLATKKPAESRSQNLLTILESRLDNIVYRAGFSYTRAHARQLINHGAICLNGKKVTMPSQLLNIGDVVSVGEKARNQSYILDALKHRKKISWLDSSEELQVVVIDKPQEPTNNIDVNLIVGFYSR